MLHVWNAICRRAARVEFPLPPLAVNESGWHRVVLACDLAAKQLDKQALSDAWQERAQRRTALTVRLTGPEALPNALAILRDPAPGRLCFIEHEGRLTASPEEVGKAARAQWGEVYTGNTSSPYMWVHADAFMRKFGMHIPSFPQSRLEPLQPARVREHFSKAPRSAAGPDGWQRDELAHMTLKAATWLTEMFHLIESGTPWPRQLLVARAIFLAKELAPSTAMQYIILTIAAHVYRRWAAMRLEDAMPWAAQWLDDSMFGGSPGRSALDASWLTSLQLEHHKSTHEHMTSLSIDIYKCFDQICRPVLARILTRLGAPHSCLQDGSVSWIIYRSRTV